MGLLKTSSHFRVEINTTKTLFKFKNLNNSKEVSINIKKLSKAFDIKNTYINSKTVLNKCLFLSDKDITCIKTEIKQNKSRFSSIEYVKTKGLEIKEVFELDNHSYLCLFKECMDL